MKNNLTACCTLATLAVFAVPQNARANAYAIADAQLDFTITATGHTRANTLVPLGTWTWSSLSTSSDSEAYWEMPPQSDSQSATGPTSASSIATAAPGNSSGGNTSLNTGLATVTSHSHSAVTLPLGSFATADNTASGSAYFKIALPGPTTPTSSSYISSWDLVITPTVSSGLTIDFSTLPGLGGLFAGGYAHYEYNVVVNTANQGHQNVSVGDTIFADDSNYGFTGATRTTLPGIVRGQTWNGTAFVGAGYTPLIKLDWMTETGVNAGNNVPESGSTALMFGAGLVGVAAVRRRQVKP